VAEPTGILLACVRAAQHVTHVARHGFLRSIKHHAARLVHIVGRVSRRSALPCLAIGGGLLTADVGTPAITNEPVLASPTIVVADLTASSEWPVRSDVSRTPDFSAIGAILLPPVARSGWLDAMDDREFPVFSASGTALPSSMPPMAIEPAPSPDWLVANPWKAGPIATFGSVLPSLAPVPLTLDGRQVVVEPDCTAVSLAGGFMFLWAIRRRPKRLCC
jgi:hypothetical protein